MTDEQDVVFLFFAFFFKNFISFIQEEKSVREKRSRKVVKQISSHSGTTDDDDVFKNVLYRNA